MTSTECLASVDVCMLRVAQLTEAGVPKQGNYGIITDDIQQAKIGPTADTVNEIIKRNGCGSIVVRVPPKNLVKGSLIDFDLTYWNRPLLNLLLGGSLWLDAGASNAPGAFALPKLADGQAPPVCIEVWSRAWSGSSQAVTAISTPNVSYHHWVMPYVRCSITSQFTLANGDAVFTIHGEGQENAQITADGPWNDWPSWIAGHGGFTSSFGEYDDGTIPTASCGLVAVPATS